MRELGDALGINSTSHANALVKQLIGYGYVQTRRGRIIAASADVIAPPDFAAPRQEWQEQATLIEWVDLLAPRFKALRLLYAIPNGEARDARTGAKLKKMGVKAGMPDLCLPVARMGFHALYLELKAEGGKTSKAQDEVIAWLRAEGNKVVVAVGYEGGRDALCEYLGLPDDVRKGA